MEDTEGDEKDDVKRKCRNLSEKKRRDQFNLLINELASMVSVSNRKMDKSTVLKATIAFFKNQKESSTKPDGQRARDDWQPSFLRNEEFTHLMLEALDGFIMTLSTSGRILYTSESITPLLGHIPSEVSGCCLCDFMPSEEQEEMRRFLSNPALAPGISSCPEDYQERYSIAIHVQRGHSSTSVTDSSPPTYERIHLTGYFERFKCPSEDGVLEFSCGEGEEGHSIGSGSTSLLYTHSPDSDSVEPTKIVFVAIARLEHPMLLREMIILEPTKSEFTSRHSLEWKFLFLDHRAPTIIGYLPFEVLGTSGYDYYHVDDLESVSQCHEILMKKGKGSSCFYRFLTKGQQWIWLKSHYYITYHQWNSKPEFIVCTNTVVSYNNIRNSTNRKEKDDVESEIKSQSESKLHTEPLPTLHEASSSKEETDFLAGPSKLSSHCQTHTQHEQEQEKSHISQRRHTVNTDSNQGKSYQRFPLTRRQYQSQKLQLGREKHVRQSQYQQQVDSSPGSPNSQHSHHSAYSYPLVQNTESSGEPPPWSRRTKSVSSQYSSSSAQSDDCLTRTSLVKRARIDISQQRQQHQQPQSYNYPQSSTTFHDQEQHQQQQEQRSHQEELEHHQVQLQQQQQIQNQQQQIAKEHSSNRSQSNDNNQDEEKPVPSPSSDISVNSHGSYSSRGSLYQYHQKGKKKSFAQTIDIHGELTQSLLSSHISKEYDAKEFVRCFPMPTSTDASSSCLTASNSRLLSPSNVTSMRHQTPTSHYQQQPYDSALQSNIPLQGGCSSIDANIACSSNPSQIIQPSMNQQPPVVQVAAVPLTSVIPVQPVVTNNLVRFSNPSSPEDLQHSIIMSYEQQQLQEQLKRKHSELQQHIMRQQEELRKVNEQLIMAQYGVNVQPLKEDVPNVNYNRGENPSSSSPSYDLNITGGVSSNLRSAPLSVVPLHTGVTMSSRASLSQHQHYVSSSSSLNEQSQLSVSSNIGIPSLQAIGVQGVAVPYQLPQQQAQMLFTNQRQGNNSYHENQHRQRQSQQPPQ